jgi:hypothetical protein
MPPVARPNVTHCHPDNARLGHSRTWALLTASNYKFPLKNPLAILSQIRLQSNLKSDAIEHDGEQEG